MTTETRDDKRVSAEALDALLEQNLEPNPERKVHFRHLDDGRTLVLRLEKRAVFAAILAGSGAIEQDWAEIIQGWSQDMTAYYKGLTAVRDITLANFVESKIVMLTDRKVQPRRWLGGCGD